MGKTMRAAMMKRKREIAIESMPMPKIEAGQVLIQVKTVGVCGSDLHYYEDGGIGDIRVEPPFILGHEVSGIIADIGGGVQHLKVGQRVAVEPGVPCGTCEFCRQGNYNLCPDVRFLATPPVNGGFCEYLAYPAQWVYPIPDSVSDLEGAMIEPLAVGMHASEIAGAELGDTAFIFGCGCIGLLTLLVLKSRGVSEIYMCDVIQSRMDKAMELGAAKVFHGRDGGAPEKVMELTQGRGVDHVFEMTGSRACLKEAAGLVKKGGSIVLVGLGADSVMDFDFGKLIWKEGRILTCFRYKNSYPKAIRAIAADVLDVKSVVSHRVGLEELPEAMELHVKQKQDVIKMVVELDKSEFRAVRDREKEGE